MIYGVGTDIVRIERMKRFCEKGYMERCFSKAVGKDIFGVLKDTEVCYDSGKPFFGLKNGTGEGLRFSLSISHDGDYAVAFVVAEVE